MIHLVSDTAALIERLRPDSFDHVITSPPADAPFDALCDVAAKGTVLGFCAWNLEMRMRLIAAVTEPGDTVADFYADVVIGIENTYAPIGEACILLGRRYVGFTDSEARYTYGNAHLARVLVNMLPRYTRLERERLGYETPIDD